MTHHCNHETDHDQYLCVSKVPIFNHLSTNEMEKIVRLASNKVFQKGEILFRDGDPLEYLYIVHTGQVKMYQLFESGKEQLLRVLNPGEFMGELALFTEKYIDSYAEAMKPTNICAIHRKDIQQLMQAYPSIAMKIVEKLSSRLEETEELVSQLSVKDVETRTASYLVKLAEKENSLQIKLPISKKDLASFLGTTQETISRRLSTFQANDWIEQKGHRNITIRNLEALTEIANDT
ncbi:Crp/Fnr family transcriptional regulator [Ornithinibacillus gellani]|uniref:Crp/Fnr family transcriptional regulator n=1 Tax=Ornithinibacillus gellani TaxID=2293253 RepID=UPI000F4890B6|nr:Crp/Fnr family transcriptional regulator [Ornithinibacillus gellani]TQS75984.1 Crp/Fnr family transcriptional regulator [Ornithinibacillus gellani]